MDIKEFEPVDPSCSVTIGDEFRATNKIEFKLKLSAQTKESVVLMLKIPVDTNTGLLRQDSDSNDLDIEFSRRSPEPAEPLKVTPVKTEIKGFKPYYLGSGMGVAIQGEVEYRVSIGKILCNARPGNAKIEVQARAPKKKDAEPPDVSKEVTVKKKEPTPSEVKNPILYFIAEPSFVIGEGNVKLSWSVVSPQTPPLKIKLSTQRNPNGEDVTSVSSLNEYLRDTPT
jgi:hypothetical protein